MSQFVQYPRTSPFVVEGYAQQPTADERFLLSRSRAQLVRDYILGRYGLDPKVIVVMPMGADADGSPSGEPGMASAWPSSCLLGRERRHLSVHAV